MIAVPTEAESRYAVSTHVTPFSEVCRSCWIVGRAGTTAELRIAIGEPGDREHRQRHVRMAALSLIHPGRLTTWSSAGRGIVGSAPRPPWRRVLSRASTPTKAIQALLVVEHDRALRVGGRRPVAQGRPAASSTRRPATSRGVRDGRGLLPRLHHRLDPDARRVADPCRLPARAAGRDGLDAREVPARWRVDARGADGRAAAIGRRDRHTDGARVDPARGRAVGDLRRDRLRRQPRLGRRRPCSALGADPVRAPAPSVLHPRVFRPLAEKMLQPVRRQDASSRCRSR